MTREQKAREYFLEGYNCAQAVALAFADLTAMDEETLARLASPFGGGMGRMREVCGAVSGMFMVKGLVDGYSDPEAKDEKKQLYAEVQTLAARFREECGSIICRELLEGKADSSPTPTERTAEFYKKRPCAELVALAAKILDEELEKEKC
ncbi:MAG: C_GCAxxG_C_C family protein [Clostridia bacterium]|nr:C_GCAxxG_C_C family protein [Clostridia bacterium]